MAKKEKFYVVWVGAKPGVYTDWDKAKKQITGFPDAKYKSFETAAAAETAFKGSYKQYYDFSKSKSNATTPTLSAPKTVVSRTSIIQDSLSVDAACSGNPGAMEYRGVYTKTKDEIFHQGPFSMGTNNVGEFLAIVHGLAYLKKEGRLTTPIYSDSKTAQAWVRNRKPKTNLVQSAKNKPIFDLLDRAVKWLETNTYQNPILKWDTENWGEIPADFGRK
ncbi:MAG: viroplasmin family protein [Saprospiraceae bacterium]|nr:viroplasmin family protein [Saprospiraceae bacterium]